MIQDSPSRAASVSVTINLFLLVLKITVGLMTGSIAVLSDGLDSAEDVIASAATWLSVRISQRPPDFEHPYGHGKVETLSAAFEAGVIFVAVAFITYGAIDRIRVGGKEIETTLGFVAMAITLLTNFLAAMYVSRTARRTGSLALTANARHLYINMMQAVVVLTGLALVAVTDVTLFDPIAALLLAAWMGWLALGILRSAVNEIMDVRLPEEEERLIISSLNHGSRCVRGYYGLRTRRSGQQRYVDLNLVVDPQSTVEEVHQICDEIEAQIVRSLPNSVVTIHVEPADGRTAYNLDF